MRTTAQEATPQLWEIAPRGSQGRSIYKISVKGELSAIKGLVYKSFVTRSWCHLEGIKWFSRFEEVQRLGSWNQFLKISQDLFHQIPWSTEGLTPPWTPSEGIEGQQLQQHRVQCPQKQMANALVFVSLKRNQPWIFIGRTDAEAPILWLTEAKSQLIGKEPDAGKDRKQEKGATDDEMAGWHPPINGHEFEQTSGDSEGQGSLACCSPWDRKELDMTEQLNNFQVN